MFSIIINIYLIKLSAQMFGTKNILYAIKSSKNPTVLFMLGGPGCGKGTQSSRIQSKFKFTHLSAGQLLRKQRQRPDSEDGNLIQNCIVSGNIVPSRITVKLLNAAMMDKGWQNGRFLIDGFPRNLENLQTWNRMMGYKTVQNKQCLGDCKKEHRQVEDQTIILKAFEKGLRHISQIQCRSLIHSQNKIKRCMWIVKEQQKIYLFKLKMVLNLQGSMNDTNIRYKRVISNQLLLFFFLDLNLCSLIHLQQASSILLFISFSTKKEKISINSCLIVPRQFFLLQRFFKLPYTTWEGDTVIQSYLYPTIFVFTNQGLTFRIVSYLFYKDTALKRLKTQAFDAQQTEQYLRGFRTVAEEILIRKDDCLSLSNGIKLSMGKILVFLSATISAQEISQNLLKIEAPQQFIQPSISFYKLSASIFSYTALLFACQNWLKSIVSVLCDLDVNQDSSAYILFQLRPIRIKGTFF